MRLPITLGLVSTIALSACGGAVGGKATKEDLAKAVIESLTKKDKAAFTGLYVSIDTVMSACPDMSAMKDKLTERFDKTRAKASENFDTCAALDWSKAKPLETKGGDLRDPDKQCPDVVRMRDVEVVAEIDGKKVTIKLDDPVKVKTGMFLSDRFECEVEGATPAEPAADAKPAEPAEAKPVEEAKPAEPAAEAKPAEPAGGADKPAAAATGNEVCDKFLVAFEKCIAAMPEAARGPASDSLKQMKDAWAQIPDKTMMTSACEQAMGTMKQSLGSFCPGAFD
jgi:hypothetical protein